MAYWYLNFAGFHSGRNWQVRIGGLSGSTNRELVGGSSPVVLDEDDDDDVFAWVRTVTGQLTIVDNGKCVDGTSFDWRDLLPVRSTDRPVTISFNGTTVWYGYLQGATYSGSLNNGAQVRTFGLQCELSQFGGDDYSARSEDLGTFAGILYNMFASTNALTFHFQGVGIERDWLRRRLNYRTLLDNDGRSRYSYLALLTEICKFFGWCCRVKGSAVYFTRVTDYVQSTYDFEVLTLNDLSDIENGISVTFTTERWDDVTFSTAWYDGADNQEIYFAGWRRSNVVAAINPHDLQLELPVSEIEAEADDGTVTETTYGSDGHKYERTGLPSTYDSNSMTVQILGDSAYAHQLDYFEGDPSDKHNYDWKTSIHMGTNLSRVKWTSNGCVNFDHGVLVLNGKMHYNDVSGGTHTEVVSASVMFVEMWIGDWNFNGTSWSYYPMTQPDVDYRFSVPIRNGIIEDNRVLTAPYPAFNGYGCPVTGSLGGDLEVTLWVPILDNSGMELDEFSMTFLRENGYVDRLDKDENTYTAQNGSGFSGRKEVNIDFGTDNNNQFGYGIVLNEDGSYCTALPYMQDSGVAYDERPEQHLCDVMNTYGSQRRCQQWLTLRWDAISNWSPLTRVYKNSETWWFMSWSLDVREETCVVKVAEVP